VAPHLVAHQSSPRDTGIDTMTEAAPGGVFAHSLPDAAIDA
jgi:hypothetical protein